MAVLPTLTVTDAQLVRIQNAYGDIPTYKTWLREKVIEYVKASEGSAILAAADQQQIINDADIDSVLTSIDPAV